MHITIKQITRN